NTGNVAGPLVSFGTLRLLQDYHPASPTMATFAERGPSGTQPACHSLATEAVCAQRSTTMYRQPLWLGLCCLLLISRAAFAAPPDPIRADEQTLQAAGLGTDDAALIDFFR